MKVKYISVSCIKPLPVAAPPLQAQTEHPGDSAHSHRWTSLELVKGTYSTDDSPSDISEIRLDKAVPLKVRPSVRPSARPSVCLCVLNGDPSLGGRIVQRATCLKGHVERYWV